MLKYIGIYVKEKVTFQVNSQWPDHLMNETKSRIASYLNSKMEDLSVFHHQEFSISPSSSHW